MIPLPPLPPPEEPAKLESERILPDPKPKDGIGIAGTAAAFVLAGGIVFVLSGAVLQPTRGATRSAKLQWEKKQQHCAQQIQQLEADSNVENPTSENSNP